MLRSFFLSLWAIVLITIYSCDAFAPLLRARTNRRHADALASASSSASDDDDRFNVTRLSERVREIESQTSAARDEFFDGLYQRVRETASADEAEASWTDADATTTTTTTTRLPVVCLDAILPRQRLEGSTEDPVFARMLTDAGLGGWFVMTSLDPRQRRVRRHGVLCKIEFLDARTPKNGNAPTSVGFSVVGRRRCRVVGPAKDATARVGRWRRSYDENGEEAVLGWGEERLTDSSLKENDDDDDDDDDDDESCSSLSSSVPTPIAVDTDVDRGGLVVAVAADRTSVDRAVALAPLVEEWYRLASDATTYENVNVTASTRAKRGSPFLTVEPGALLRKVRASLGDRPSPADDPVDFAFWAGALVNPLPPLGVSLEMRGRLLEATDVEERLGILERGLVRSIANLKGERPL